jgi:hypothetical protein
VNQVEDEGWDLFLVASHGEKILVEHFTCLLKQLTGELIQVLAIMKYRVQPLRRVLNIYINCVTNT